MYKHKIQLLLVTHEGVIQVTNFATEQPDFTVKNKKKKLQMNKTDI